MTDEEVHVEVARIHFGDQVVSANELLHGVQPFHFAMLVLNELLGLRRSTQPRILPVPFFGTGKKVDQRLLEVSGDSSWTERILR